MTPLLKAYYLLQASYWIQQLFVMVLGLEKRRKDFMELVMHHIVTIYLISASYTVGLTWIGNAVFITMDVSDAFFSVSSFPGSRLGVTDIQTLPSSPRFSITLGWTGPSLSRSGGLQSYGGAFVHRAYTSPRIEQNGFSYTRHWLNFVMLYSVWFEFDLIP